MFLNKEQREVIKALMWWYNVNKHDAEKYLKYLSQSVINVIVKFYKNKDYENC